MGFNSGFKGLMCALSATSGIPMNVIYQFSL